MDSPIQSPHEECPDIPAFRQRRQNLAKLMSPKSAGTVFISKAHISLNMCLDDSCSFHDKMLCPLPLVSTCVIESNRAEKNPWEYNEVSEQLQTIAAAVVQGRVPNDVKWLKVLVVKDLAESRANRQKCKWVLHWCTQ